MLRPEPRELLPLRFVDAGFRAAGRVLLEGLRFELGDGGVSVILGANGAGKSLTLRLAHGLIAPTSGRVEWAGGAAAARKYSTLVFQKPVLFRRSARANVMYALRLRGDPRSLRRERADRALEALGLGELADRPARRLSGGEQQRLALARARALEPAVLFLDEPAASLDPGAAAALEASIARFRDEGTKIVMTTHDLEQARRMADEVLFLHRGRLLEQTLADEFFRGPRSIEAEKFLKRELIG